MSAIALPVAATHRPPIAQAIAPRNKWHRRPGKWSHHRNPQLPKHAAVYAPASAQLRRRDFESTAYVVQTARTCAPQIQSAPAETTAANDAPGNPSLYQTDPSHFRILHARPGT